MKEPKLRPAPRKTQRRWRIPPALMHGSEVFEGLGVLDDLPGETGLVLWQSLRDANLWAEAEDRRAGLFAADAEPARAAALESAGSPAELATALGMLSRMVGDPAGIAAEEVAAACHEISRWADGKALLSTALAFAQAAALAEPTDAAAACTVGRLARRAAEYNRAETWYRRTVALARQSGDWATYSLAFVGLGNLYSQRGNLPSARRFHLRALRAARRNTLRELEGMALHEMFGIAIEAGNRREAEGLARAAFEAWGPGHKRLPRLAHDVAYYWTTRGHFGRALPVFQSLLPHFPEPAMRLLVLADIARAAGGARDSATFVDAWVEAGELLHGREVREAAARALLDLAHGAASLGAWDKAESAARDAISVATERGESRIVMAAEALMESARRHSAVATSDTEPAEIAAAADALAGDFVRSLTAVA